MTDQELKPVNPFLRGGAATIDMFIVGFLRILFVQIIGDLWIDGELIKFAEDFNTQFGNIPFSGANQDHVQFLASHGIVSVMLIFLILVILVGALYHAFFNSSSWSATIGKRVANVILVKNEGKSLTFWQSFWHYGLSLVPWIFMIYILLYQVKEKTTLYTALVDNPVNLTLGLITVLWLQIHILTKKKNTVQDIAIGCCMVKGRIGKGWPKIKLK